MRAFVIVIDGFGIGAMPDCKLYGDFGSNTLKNTLSAYDMYIPNLKKLGLYNIDGVYPDDRSAKGAYGRMAELSKAKDTTAGHWEIAGVITSHPFPVFPDGFPKELVDKLEKIFGNGILLNKPYSGTDAIRDYGEEHLKTGKPIVYTSADSVLQVACHIDKVPLNQLYDWCEKIRAICVDEYSVSRIIARPFGGKYPFERTVDRKDFSLSPPSATLLDEMKENKFNSVGIGKIEDIFNFSGLTESYHTHTNKEGMEKLIELANKEFDGLVFANLVDTDMLYGHRRDVFGYAQAMEEIDKMLGLFMPCLKHDDVLYITSDHGNDPTHKAHTDHTREYTPLLIYGRDIVPTNLGTLVGFDVIADTIREQFALPNKGKSLWQKITL
ncbi:MAG TPA: phosphopentomutase [Clostridia bacterium]|nr:phosphopentomutase [Clostridia bacterium]